MMDAGTVPAIATGTLSLWLILLVKATIVLLLAWISTVFLKRRSAAIRSLIWSIGLSSLIFLPALTMILPAWHLEQFWLNEEITEEDGRSWPPEVVENDPNEATIFSSSLSAYDYYPGNGDATGNTTTTAKIIPISVMIITVIWLGGAIILLLRLLYHSLRVRELRNTVTLEDDSIVTQLANQIAESLGIQRSFKIALSSKITIPLSTGLKQPVILLPMLAENWPEQRLRSVLLHEMAHVVRWDFITHYITEVVRALYWLNPLVWLAARYYAMERESACDDFAITGGTPSKVYASELLQVARAQFIHRVPVAAIAMANKSDLARRLLCITDVDIDRSPFREGSLFLVAYLAFLIILPLACLNATAASPRLPGNEQLITDLHTHTDPLIRRQAAWWLGEHESNQAVMSLIEALSDESADVRLVSAWALGEIKSDKAIVPLIWSLDDNDPFVREMAALALGEIEDPAAVNALSKKFESNEELRGAIIWALGEISGREAQQARDVAFQVLEQDPWQNDQIWTGSLDWNVLNKVNRSNGHFKITGDPNGLIGQLDSKNATVRRDAAFNIGLLGILDQIQSTDAISSLLDKLRDQDPSVRAMAVWALDEINPSRSQHWRNPSKQNRRH